MSNPPNPQGWPPAPQGQGFGGQAGPGPSGHGFAGQQGGPGAPAYGRPGSAPQGWGPRPPAGPGGPTGPGGPQQPGRPPKDPAAAARTRRIIIGVVAAVLVLVLAGVSALVYQNNQRRRAAERAEQARIAEENRQKASAADTVRAYYDALVAGDADRAKGMGATPPTDRADLLTREVLTEAMKKAPIKDLRTTATSLSGTTASVEAAYTIGDKPVTTTHEVTRSGDAWQLRETTTSVSVGATGPVRLVNGKEVPAGRYRLFPGGYSITASNPFVTVTNGDFVVNELTGTTAASPAFAIHDQGKREALEATKRAVNDCLGKRELSPAGCPMIRWRTEPDVKVDMGSLRYTLSGDPFAGVQPICTDILVRCRLNFTTKVSASGRGSSPRGSLTLSGDQTTSVTSTVTLDSGRPEVTLS